MPEYRVVLEVAIYADSKALSVIYRLLVNPDGLFMIMDPPPNSFIVPSGDRLAWEESMKLADVYQMRDKKDLKGLLTALGDGDEYVRRGAVEALAGFRDPVVRDVLERLQFEDPVDVVRKAAMKAYTQVVEGMHQKEA